MCELGAIGVVLTPVGCWRYGTWSPVYKPCVLMLH